MISRLLYSSEYAKKLRGSILRIVNKGKSISIGRNLKCDSLPYILVTENGRISIGRNVYFRRDVEIRVHGNSNLYIGDSCQIDRGVRILAANNACVEIANGTKVGLYSVLNGGDDIRIGKNCLISGFVYLQTSMHNHKSDLSIQQSGYCHSPIKIGTDVWIGAHATVLPGCCLCDGTVVGSNAVVNKNTSAGDIIAGVPAKKIDNRNNY